MYWRRASSRRIAALAVVAVLVAAGARPGLASPPQPDPDEEVLVRLRSGRTPAGEALLVGSDVQVGVAPPTEVLVPVAAFDMGTGQPVTVKEISVAGPDGKTRARIKPQKRLAPITDLAPTANDVMRWISDRNRMSAGMLLERGHASQKIPVPVADLALPDGTTTTFTATGVFDVGGKEATAVVPLAVTVAALPVQPNWHAGDAHVHSSTWSDGWYTIATRAGEAKAAGHKWLAMTDHWRGIWAVAGRANANWGLYCQDCAANQTASGIPVLPGVELMVANGGGHALGYALSASKVPPRDEALSAQELISAIANHTAGSSSATLAHPYQGWPNTPWLDWNATGFRALELMSNERQASASTQSRWFALLRAGTASRIAGGPFVVGLGNTDAHFQRPGEAGMNWIRSSASPLSSSAVWSAIRSGACSASGREDLGYFSVNGVQQGGVASAAAGSTLTFSITQRPVTGRKCTEISVRNGMNEPVWSVSNPTTSTYVKSLPVPAADTFYVVKMVFAKTNATDYSHVWCNPVFIDRR